MIGVIYQTTNITLGIITIPMNKSIETQTIEEVCDILIANESSLIGDPMQEV